MKAFVSAVIALIILAVAGSFALAAIQEPVYKAFATSGTRVGDPGYNLVGHR